MKIGFAFLGVLVGVLAVPAAASASDLGMDLHAGTLGLGAELNYSLNDYFTVRGDFNKFDHTYAATKEQINYNLDLNLKSYGVLFDWHPMAGSFRVTAGYFSNKNAIGAAATPDASGNYTINGTTYSASQVGTLSGAIGFNSSAPYFGIGWSTVGTKDTGLGFEFDLGALLQGSPTATLSATGGSIDSNAKFQSDLAQEQAKFQNDVNNFKTYPVISLGLVYRF